jgi:hypothetical protein
MRKMKTRENLGVIGIIIIALAGGLAVSGLLSTSRTLPSTGTIMAINVEVYWDSGGTQNVTSIDWGIPAPGDVVSKTVYVKNSGNNVMNISMSISGWTPAGAAAYLTVTWDQEGAVVAAGGTVQAIISLDVSGGITGISDFSFDIVIEGTG